MLNLKDSEFPELTGYMETPEDTQRGKFLTFSVGKESYGIEIKFVTEIIVIQEITEVTELPDYVRGIINLRGKIIPVIDVRIRFKKESKEYNDRTCIVVIDIKGTSVGLIVDIVAEIINIDDSDIVMPPDIKTGFQNSYVRGIGKTQDGIKLLLDCEKILNHEELEGLNTVI